MPDTFGLDFRNALGTQFQAEELPSIEEVTVEMITPAMQPVGLIPGKNWLLGNEP